MNAKSALKSISKRCSIQVYEDMKTYKKETASLTKEKREKSSLLAVVLHLYYIESWNFFCEKLRNLKGLEYDIFITIPESNRYFSETIRKTFKSAHVIVVPNRGRDVLPFIKIARILDKKGYEYILKIHSKKSTHRTDGKEWLDELINNLLPDSPKQLKSILQRLDNNNTGIIGPYGHYLSLRVNFEANGKHMYKILSKMHSRALAEGVLHKHRVEYGFFAGTMFWARLDALEYVLNQDFGVSEFEQESGQIDATFAHALERVFCLEAEIQNRDMYVTGNGGVQKIQYNSGVIPDWSDVYVGPK